MKLYMYYLISASLISKFTKMHVFRTGFEPEPNKPFLYAFTSDKKKAKKFEQSRNMDVFYGTHELIDDDSYEYTISRSSCKIINYRVQSSDSIIEIPVTENEAWLLERPSETMFDYLKGSRTYPPLAIFSGKLYEFLAQISYGYVADCQQINNYDYEEIEGMREFQNELGVFIYLFSETIDHSDLIDVAVACKELEEYL